MPITDHARSVACPICGAEPGAKCRNQETGDTAPGYLAHQARTDAWKAQHGDNS